VRKGRGRERDASNLKSKPAELVLPSREAQPLLLLSFLSTTSTSLCTRRSSTLPTCFQASSFPQNQKNTVILPGTPSGKPQRHVPLRENDPRPPFTQLFEHEPRPAPSSPSSFLDKLASFTRRRSSTSKPSQQGLFSPLPPCLRPNLLSLPSTATAAPSSFLLNPYEQQHI